VAKQCTYCGQTLPRDDARFCNNCGKTLPSPEDRPPSVNDQSENATPSTQQPSPPARQLRATVVPQQSPRPALREQIAQQPYSRSAKYSLPRRPPPWINQLEKKVYHAQSLDKHDDHIADVPTISQDHRQDANKTPGDLEHEQPEIEAPPGDEIPPDHAQAGGTSPEEVHPPVSLTGSAPRELRVRVWEQQEGVDSAMQEQEHRDDDLPTMPLAVADTPLPDQSSSISAKERVAGEEEIVDDLPTRPLLVTPPQASTPDEISSDLFPGFDEVEALDTRPLLTQLQGRVLSPATGVPAEPHKQAFRDQPGPAQVQKPITPAPFPQLGMEPAQRHTPPVSSAAPPLARPEHRKKNRRRLALVFGLLVILLAGAVVAWIMLFQPFTVPPITQTTRPFQNTDLGVSLHYPEGWTARVDKQNGAVYIYDDNQTDQVDIRAAGTNGQSIDQYISKQVALLGMTGQKTGTSLSFAGVSWQQVQGSVLQSGASYTAALLVTTRGDRYYSIIQLAPSTTFAQEDQLVFSGIRSSFQFIGNHTQ
jgi:hypothetical protein